MKLIARFTLLSLVAVLSSCHHKDLCYVHPHSTHLRIVFDWSEAPEALENLPKGMCVYFYSEDRQGEASRFDFPGSKEGYLDLPAGKYKIITYNNDTEAVKFSTTHDFDNHAAYTRTGDILEPLYGNGITSKVRSSEDERVVITPDRLYGCAATEIEISEHGTTVYHITRSVDNTAEVTTDDEGNQTLTLYPHDMLCHYTYEVRNVSNIGHISMASGALSGMAGEMQLSDEQLGSESVTLPFSAQINKDNDTLTGHFLTFGHNEKNTDPNRMSFYIVMDDGSKYSFTTGDYLDVSSQIRTAPDRRHVHLIIDRLDLPTPIENGSGFRPDVEDWGVVREDIEM